MEIDWSALAGSAVASHLREARWGYAVVNTAHVLGIAMLVGAMIPLDLRLLGLWRSTPLDALLRVLAPVATAGLMLALTAGVLLFSVRPAEYASLTVFQVKMGLIVLGLASALTMHRVFGRTLSTASRPVMAVAALVSLTCWLGALVLGRMIAFAAD